MEGKKSPLTIIMDNIPKGSLTVEVYPNGVKSNLSIQKRGSNFDAETVTSMITVLAGEQISPGTIGKVKRTWSWSENGFSYSSSF